MKELSFKYNDKSVLISSFANNIIRVRVGKKFEPTLFERYNIWKKPDDCGETIENGIKAGDLTVSYDKGGNIVFKTSRVERTISLKQENVSEIHDYFHGELHDLRPERKDVIGDINKWETTLQKFDLDPKYYTLKTEGETFYGLGESNTDRLILNGKCYLDRVVYVRCEIPIPYFLTKAGYGILISNTIWHGVDVCKKNENEVTVYLPDTDIDFFIFAGNTLKEINERFTYLTGRSLLLPKFAYGLTFVEQDIADQFEIMKNAQLFREKGIPLDMISLEPGWMEKRYDFSVNKEWNQARYYIRSWMRGGDEPRSGEFTAALKRRLGIKIQLWLCCQHDFTAYEERLAGNDVANDIPEWFEHLKKFQKDGAYSFKVDPCHVVDSTDESRLYANGKLEPEMHNLMQTLCVKDMYQGALDNKNRRPMHHFCGGYTSANAYSAFTTGDSGGELKTLVWILNTGLSGLSNITCDMNIHTERTLHYGFLTAWAQLNSWSGFQYPWWAEERQEKLFTFYANFRYKILPYIYSTAIETSLNGMPMCRAMPYEYEDEELQNCTTEYMFGPSLLVASFCDELYLPKNNLWIDYWTGDEYEGGQVIPAKYPSDRAGVLLVKGGSIIPTETPRMSTDCKDINNYIIEVYPYKKSSYLFYEDDGSSMEYKNNKRTETLFTCEKSDKEIIITVGKRMGSFDGMVNERTYTFNVFSKIEPKSVSYNDNNIDFEYSNNCITFDGIEDGKVTIQL